MTVEPKVSFTCPHCLKALTTITARFRTLKEENDKLKAENNKLRKVLSSHEADFDCNGMGIFVGSKNGPHFHRPECKWVEWISRGSIQEFFTHKEAVDAGYKPCKTCRA